MKEVVFFSNNQNKITEILKLLNSSNLNILSLNDFKQTPSPKETGKTFEDNAKIKSNFGFKTFKKICFADDSGICIDALDGGPGVNSKDFISKNNETKVALKEIINLTKKTKKFKAFFQTSICLSISKERSIFFNGLIEGEISKEIKGVFGFGYDPIFIPKI